MHFLFTAAANRVKKVFSVELLSILKTPGIPKNLTLISGKRSDLGICRN